MLLLQKLLLEVQIVGSCWGAKPLRIHSNELKGQLSDDSTPDEALDGLLVCPVLVQVPKANCHNRWTVSELRPNPKPLVAGTAFQRFEEGAISALTKPEAALTPRRNLSERHVYDQLSRHATKTGVA